MQFITKLKECRLDLLSAYYRTKPIQQNKILMWSDLGKRYTCNPRYLSEYIHAHCGDRFELVWMFSEEIEIPKEFPADIRTIRYFSKDFLYELATAKFIVCNSRIPKYFLFRKRPGQVYIQTWHSSLRLKAIEKDAVEDLTPNYIDDAKFDSSQIDYVISGCEFSSRIYQNSFWYDGKLLECGTPRVDFLLNQLANHKALLKKANLSDQLHYALYAPTFRKGNDLSAYDIDSERLSEALSQRFGGKWKILYRLHPNIADAVSFENLPDCCIDASHYQDMQELLVLSDVLITDYSSSMFDVAYLEKPCILYASDLDAYISKERKLYFDIGKLPFPVVRNNDALEQCIQKFDAEKYRREIHAFLERIGSFESGTACERIVNDILLSERPQE